MPTETGICARCGASFAVPQSIRVLLADTAASREAESERVLRFCPACRPQKFAEGTVNNAL
jgi:hypothetical protein